jgi:hypothetical protein
MSENQKAEEFEHGIAFDDIVLEQQGIVSLACNATQSDYEIHLTSDSIAEGKEVHVFLDGKKIAVLYPRNEGEK